MKSITSRLVLFLMMLMIAATTVHASEVRTTSTGATKVTLQGSDAAAALAKVLVGGGVEGIDAPDASATAGGTIYWVKTRDKIDHLGNRHVFYQQMYAPPKTPGRAVSSLADLGVELDGATVGLHYQSGELRFVLGAQFEDVANVSVPVIGDAMDAYEAVLARATEWPDFSQADPLDVPRELATADLSKARVKLRNTGDGTTFRYEWRVRVRDSDGFGHVAMLDAETAVLRSLRNPLKFDECGPDMPLDLDIAVGIPQNSSISDRYLFANDSDEWSGSLTHEAYRGASGSIPNIEILFRNRDKNDYCDNSGGDKWSLLPMETESGYPTYDDLPNDDPEEIEIPGRAAADAMHHNYLTMATFDDYGRRGWDDPDDPEEDPADAVSVVTIPDIYDSSTSSARCPGDPTYVANRSYFNVDGVVYGLPENSVVHCQMTDDGLYNEAAALDIVAHEWGHGVIYTDVGWDGDGDEPAYHEGWADIIGHIVEWDNQSAGSGAEKADWKFGEDRGEAWRVADDYSSRMCPTIEVDEEEVEVCESFHKNDPEAYDEAHANGNRLAVAFRLMVEDDENPICDEYDYLDGCGVDPPNISVSAASDILFYTVQYLLTDSADWDDFGTLAKTAAFYLFESCPYYHAIGPQRTAYQAFEAIGYSPDDEIIPCE